jgi:hypothetical protein
MSEASFNSPHGGLCFGWKLFIGVDSATEEVLRGRGWGFAA